MRLVTTFVGAAAVAVLTTGAVANDPEAAPASSPAPATTSDDEGLAEGTCLVDSDCYEPPFNVCN